VPIDLREFPAVSWPVSQDYNEAIQDPGASFGDPGLRDAVPVTNPLGLPVPCSGSFADVYHLRHPAGGSWAVKCFTRPVADRQERYHEISSHLRRARLPFTIDFTYLEEGIRVHGRWYPVVKMQWVEGLLLNQFVRDSLTKPAQLESLLKRWERMARRLREADVAHGDLQHGNVLLVPGSRTTSLALKLIDYDGMFVPALAGRPAAEAGHPAYQHPQRLREATSDPDVDRVPLLVIATALRGLIVAGPSLWQRYDNGDNLLFREADLRAPGQSALFRQLWRLQDPLLRVLTARLALACEDPLELAPPLTALLAEDLLPVLGPEQKVRAEKLLGSPVHYPVGLPAGDAFEFVEVAPRRTPRRPNPTWVAIAWASVGFLALVLALALALVWWLTQAAPDAGREAGAREPKKGAASTGRARATTADNDATDR
jgi:hypothetical protein